MRSFFSVELCFPFANAAQLHEQLKRVIARAPEAATLEQKWTLHNRAAQQLEQYMDEAVRGCWEYMDDDTESNMWNDWMRPLDDPSRRPKGREAGGYFTFTIMMQPVRHSPTDRIVAGAFQQVGDQTWRKGTFASMLRTIPGISFANIARDAMYLMPRDSTCGWTDAELALEHMKYLRVLG